MWLRGARHTLPGMQRLNRAGSASDARRLQNRDRQRRLTPLSWSDEFEDPIPGMTSLRDAASYIQTLPKAEQNKPHWQTAVEMLIKAAEGRGPLLHARVGMLRAMNHDRPRVFSDRKESHWGSGS
jgi:hypothetical protein